MEIVQILKIIELVSKSDLVDVEIEKDDFKMRLRKGYEPQVNTATSILPVAPSTPVTTAYIPEIPPTKNMLYPVPQLVTQPSADVAPAPAKEIVGKKQHTVKSPMIGTFYRSSGPDKDPFVKEGSVVKKGDILCIVEAMKLFNEIESDASGKIVKILVENAKPVEYDQPLFTIELDE